MLVFPLLVVQQLIWNSAILLDKNLDIAFEFVEKETVVI
jgi:hypothetical protein